MSELKSPKVLSFFVGGKPFLGREFRRTAVESHKNKFDYSTMVQGIAKMAAIEKGWEITEDPVFISVIMHTVPQKTGKKTIINKLQTARGRLQYFGPRGPRSSIIKIGQIICGMTKGVLYKNYNQICGLLVTTEPSEMDGVEVTVGTVKCIGDMLDDLQETM